MAAIDSRTWTGLYRTGPSSVIISANPTRFETGKTRESFWDSYRNFAQSAYPGYEPAIREFSADQFEQRIRQEFPQELTRRLRSSLESYLTRLSIGQTLNTAQQRALQSVNLSVESIVYGSIEVETIIENLDAIVNTLGVGVDVLTSMLIFNSPEAFNAVLSTPGAEWTIAIPAINISDPTPQPSPSPTPSPAPVASNNPRELLSHIYDSTRFWRLLNALWILPILVSLVVLILTYREMNRIIELRDADRSKVLSDEIAAARARSRRFFVQQTLLLRRHEDLLKEATETVKSILSDEIKRVAARSDYFDQQQTGLLQRYENLSKESSNLIGAHLQKADSCYRPSRCSAGRTKIMAKNPAARSDH